MFNIKKSSIIQNLKQFSSLFFVLSPIVAIIQIYIDIFSIHSVYIETKVWFNMKIFLKLLLT